VTDSRSRERKAHAAVGEGENERYPPARRRPLSNGTDQTTTYKESPRSSIRWREEHYAVFDAPGVAQSTQLVVARSLASCRPVSHPPRLYRVIPKAAKPPTSDNDAAARHWAPAAVAALRLSWVRAAAAAVVAARRSCWRSLPAAMRQQLFHPAQTCNLAGSRRPRQLETPGQGPPQNLAFHWIGKNLGRTRRGPVPSEPDSID
jgi:hypothetical protein